MSKGEKEIEELSIKDSAGYKNLIAMRDYAVQTRKEFRELQEEFHKLMDQVIQLKDEKRQLQEQVRMLQVRMYSRNSTK